VSITIFGDSFSFPEGNAATNRVYTYAKGFTELGEQTHIICFGNDFPVKKQGLADGIPYYHPYKPEQRCRSFVERRWYNLLKYFSTLRLIIQINRKEKIRAIIVYTKQLPTHTLAYIASRILHCLLIVENSEHPLRYYQNSKWKKLTGNLKVRFEHLTTDAYLLITNNLIEFYSSRTGKSSNLLLVPSTVDPQRFISTNIPLTSFEYIGYFGSINFDRDNVDLLLRAYSKITEKHSNTHLLLGGIILEEDRQKVLRLAAELGIESKFHLLGYLSRDEVIPFFMNAKLLVLVRANEPFTEASYPSKITEYLATGNPVVSVRVSEIPNYLTDHHNAYLVNPGDVHGLAEVIDEVLANYSEAKKVGLRGKELTETIFNYKYQAKRILSFLDNLN